MNIDNLDKKNIYKTPEPFFDKMQNNVLEKTIGAKVIPLKNNNKKQKNKLWWYAAAVLLVAGLGSFLSINMEKNSTEIANNEMDIENTFNNQNSYAETLPENIEQQIKQKIELSIKNI